MADVSQPRVLVVGGYGTFGRLIVRGLAHASSPGASSPRASSPGASSPGALSPRVIVAGRRLAAARALCEQIGPAAEGALLDCEAPDLEQRLASLQPALVIDTVGPFQGRDYRMARACIAIGAHYLDLADDRRFVVGIGALDAAARARGVVVASGVSTCPALSTAVADGLVRDLQDIEAMELAIAPGQRAPRGLATVRSVLSYCGKPIPALRAGQAGQATGWSGLTRHRYPAPVGSRWLSRVDLPELELWPARYPAMREMETRASLELSILHLGLALLSRGVRLGLIRSLASHARPLLRIADALAPLGSPAGAMHVAVRGRDAAGARCTRTWSILAERGDGPQIPAAPAVALARQLLLCAAGSPPFTPGARPCMGLLTLEQIMAELAPFAIRTRRDAVQLKDVAQLQE